MTYVRWSDPSRLEQDIESALEDEHRDVKAKGVSLPSEGAALHLLQTMARVCAKNNAFLCTQTIDFWKEKMLRPGETIRLATRELEERQFIEVISGTRSKGSARQSPNTYILHPWLGSWKKDAHRLRIKPKRKTKDHLPNMNTSGELTDDQALALGVFVWSSDTNSWRLKEEVGSTKLKVESPIVGENIEDPEREAEPEPLLSDRSATNGTDVAKPGEPTCEGDSSEDTSEDEGGLPFMVDDGYEIDPDNLPPPPSKKGEDPSTEHHEYGPLLSPSPVVLARSNELPDDVIAAWKRKVNPIDRRDAWTMFTPEQLRTIAYADIEDDGFWCRRNANDAWRNRFNAGRSPSLWRTSQGTPYPKRFPFQVVHFEIAEMRGLSILDQLKKLWTLGVYSDRPSFQRQQSWSKAFAHHLLAEFTTSETGEKRVWTDASVRERIDLNASPEEASNRRAIVSAYLFPHVADRWPPYALAAPSVLEEWHEREHESERLVKGRHVSAMV